MPRIFISYRRSDSAAAAGRIYDRLCMAFGEDNLFKDVDNIPPGANYRRILESEVSNCDVLLAIIGPRWLNTADESGKRRLDEPDDFVRIEIETALSREEALVIPVLVDDSPMPDRDNLPESLRELHYRNAVNIRNDPDFNRDIARLIATIQYHFALREDGTLIASIADDTFSSRRSQLGLPAHRPEKHLPWAGILAGVLLVIAVVAVISLARRISTDQALRLTGTPTTVIIATQTTTPAP